MAEKGGKLHDIKETASDAVEIMRELGTPGVQETFDKIREIALIAKEITESMKTPEWQQNIENIRLVSDNFNEMSSRMESTFRELKDSGLIDRSKELMSTVKSKMDSFGGDKSNPNGESADIKQLISSFREMLDSIKGTAEEMSSLLAESKKTGTLRNFRESVENTAQAVQSVREDARRNTR
ncbi:MAG: hypothetical protein ABI361_04775 [Nitrososphaera sp.]|jgi:hypothetical protein